MLHEMLCEGEGRGLAVTPQATHLTFFGTIIYSRHSSLFMLLLSEEKWGIRFDLTAIERQKACLHV